MTKNKLERKFSESWKVNSPFKWGLKLQSNFHSHNSVPADYFLVYETPTKFFNVLVECKMSTISDLSNSDIIVVSRLTQHEDMRKFVNCSEHHRAFYCIGFMERRFENSDIFLIPFRKLDSYIVSSGVKKLTRDALIKLFSDYKLEYRNNRLYLTDIMIE